SYLSISYSTAHPNLHSSPTRRSSDLYVLAITRDSLPLLLGLISVTTFLTFGYLGVTYAALQNFMHPRMRATCSAILNVVYGLANAFGPILLGALSDRMALDYGPAQGLAVAMAITGALYVWAGLTDLAAASQLPAVAAAVAVAA